MQGQPSAALRLVSFARVVFARSACALVAVARCADCYAVARLHTTVALREGLDKRHRLAKRLHERVTSGEHIAIDVVRHVGLLVELVLLCVVDVVPYADRETRALVAPWRF